MTSPVSPMHDVQGPLDPKLTYDELRDIRDAALFQVPCPSIWKHVKSGRVYHVSTPPTIFEESMEPLIHYHRSTEPFAFSRRLSVFLQRFRRIQ